MLRVEKKTIFLEKRIEIDEHPQIAAIINDLAAMDWIEGLTVSYKTIVRNSLGRMETPQADYFHLKFWGEIFPPCEIVEFTPLKYEGWTMEEFEKYKLHYWARPDYEESYFNAGGERWGDAYKVMEGIFVVYNTTNENPNFTKLVPIFEHRYKRKALRVNSARELLGALILFQKEELKEIEVVAEYKREDIEKQISLQEVKSMVETGGKDYKVLFVRCGERALPVGDEDEIVTLEAAMTPETAKASVDNVRQAIAGLGRVIELRVAGPGMLIGMFAQAFEHIPVEIRYSQLNQLTKAYEIWFSNKENL